MDARPGTIIDERFVLLRRLGEGAFGEVWHAEDRQRGEAVALKILRPSIARTPEIRTRFEREVSVLQHTSHPSLVTAIAARTESAPFYLAMSLVEGITAREEMVRRRRLGTEFDAEEIVTFITQLSGAIEALHVQSVVHRDIKPANVIVQNVDDRLVRAVLLDLGIAKIKLDSSAQTTVGRAMGTLMYMPPEQILGEAVDHRADIFALGTMLFEVATLRRPFAHDDSGMACEIDSKPSVVRNESADVIRRIVFDPRPVASQYRPSLGRAFDEVIERALATDREKRFNSCEELREATERALGDSPPIVLTRAPSAPSESPPTAVLPRDLSVADVPATDVSDPTPSPSSRPTRPWPFVLAAVVVGTAALTVLLQSEPQRVAIPIPTRERSTTPRVEARPSIADAGVESIVERPPRPARPAPPPPALTKRPPPTPPVDPFAFDPSDTGSVLRAADALTAAATTLADDTARKQVERCALLAKMRADADELTRCIERYRRSK